MGFFLLLFFHLKICATLKPESFTLTPSPSPFTFTPSPFLTGTPNPGNRRELEIEQLLHQQRMWTQRKKELRELIPGIVFDDEEKATVLSNLREKEAPE